MKISVHQQGGFLGLDRSIEVNEGLVTVAEKGGEQQVHQLDASQQEQLNSLAARVAEVSDEVESYSGDLVSDGLTNAIAIEDEAQSKTLVVSSGDTAPDEVWEFIGLINNVSSS